jgi:hypothetical protein
MIFNLYNNYKIFSNDKIDLEQLVAQIKNHPKKSKIDELRKLEYKSPEYNVIKSELPSITPHGTFNDSKKTSVDDLSGYLYFDIDGFTSTEVLNETIKTLNNTYQITFICKSCGGRGLAFLLKVRGITKDNFEKTHTFIRSEFKREGYDIDQAAGGLIRKWIVSYDPDVIYNKNAEYKVDQEAYERFVSENKGTYKKVNKTVSNLDDDLESDIIPFATLCSSIKIESEYKGEIVGDFAIEEMEYYRILYPQIINDGAKRRTYTRIVNALYYLNEEITQQQVYSYIYYVNRTANPPMNAYKLKELVTYLCKSIQETGVVNLKTRKKRIHFNASSNLSKREKQSMAAKITCAAKTNKTNEAVTKMKATLIDRGEHPTQVKVAEELGMSLSTVKRNWYQKEIDLFTLDFTPNNKDLNSNPLSEWDYVEEINSVNSEEPSDDDDLFEEDWPFN